MRNRALEIKAALVAAHRAKDWKRAAELSQQQQQLKRRKSRTCRVCGVAVKGFFCRMHYIQSRYWDGRAIKGRSIH